VFHLFSSLDGQAKDVQYLPIRQQGKQAHRVFGAVISFHSALAQTDAIEL